MGCCVCCLSEGKQVGKVLSHFDAISASKAQDGQLQKIVGRVVLAGQNPFYAPASGKPCVWHKTTVWEERIRIWTDSDGRRQRSYYWHVIAVAENFVDFYLQDGLMKVFVRGTGARGQCRIQGSRGGGYSGFWTGPPPPGIARMIMANMTGGYYGWGSSDFKTGRYKYSEKSFDVNEIICGFGVPQSAVDPYTNQSVKILQPAKTESISEEFMEHMKWKKIEIKSWENLTKSPAVLLSDMAEHVQGVEVTTINNLPQWQLQTATTVQQFANLYQNGAQISVGQQQQAQVVPQQQAQVVQQQYPVQQQAQVVQAQVVG